MSPREARPGSADTPIEWRKRPRERPHDREVRSFFADSARAEAQVRVCGGTSCVLSGAGRVAQALEALASCQHVHCLGYCDRSPVVMRRDGAVLPAADPGELRDWLHAANPQPPGPPSIRNRARRAIVTARIGAGDHASLAPALEAGAYAALGRVVREDPGRIIETLEQSGEQGRGGAGFSTGRKWRVAAEARARDRYVVANGDEGDPGSYVDRVLMERDPHGILEGLAICGYAVGASRGIVYVRSEYPTAREKVQYAVDEARREGILGPSVLGSGFAFDVTVASGEGSYVCGEETAMLNALEGRRGEVRSRPPYPTEAGLWGRPTVVNNVESLLGAAWIAMHGAAAFRALGTQESPGTKAICLNAGFDRPGIVEVEFGSSLRDLIETEGGGGRNGEALAAVWIGGPMGSLVRADAWDISISYEQLAERGIRFGHGGIVAIAESMDPRKLIRHALRFMAEESCGKCAPCSLGSARALELAEQGASLDAELDSVLRLTAETSACAFGQYLPAPVLELLSYAASRTRAAE